MRLWVHLIWRRQNSSILATAGPKEDRKLEDFIQLHGEQQAAYAWHLYVNNDPRPYNLEPVKHVDKFTSKAGKTYMNTLEDQGAITRFPLSAFLAMPDGFLVEAMVRLSEIKSRTPEGQRYMDSDGHFLLDAIKCNVPGLRKSWGESPVEQAENK